MQTPQSITIRRPRLSFLARMNPVFVEGQPELSYVLLGLSLSLPYLEPFVIRTMKSSKLRVTDPALREAIDLLSAQEAQHVRLHTRFNKAVCEKFPELEALEQELAQDCQRFTETRSLEWRLAYVEGVEAFTVALAGFLFEEQLLRDAEPNVRDLFEWHILEELEHRSVAFDVHRHLNGSYLQRAAVGLYAQWHFCRFVIRATRAMLAHDLAHGRDHGGKVATRSRMRPLLAKVARGLVPKVLRSFSPRYSPHKIGMPPGIEGVVQRLADADAVAPLRSAS